MSPIVISERSAADASVAGAAEEAADEAPDVVDTAAAEEAFPEESSLLPDVRTKATIIPSITMADIRETTKGQ